MTSRFFFLFVFCFASMYSFVDTVLADSDDFDFFYGRNPMFYDDSMQDGRNICLGIILADKSRPGINSDYSAGGYVFGTDSNWIVFEDHDFATEDARATIRSKYKNDDGENYNLYLFIVPDACVPDEDTDYSYRLYHGGIPFGFPNDDYYLNGIKISYAKTDEECGEITEETCTSMDLTEFYSWEADDDDTPDNDDDDATDEDDDDNDNDDNGCGCGCHITGNGTPFPLVLFMLAVGIVAWLFTRRNSVTVGAEEG